MNIEKEVRGKGVHRPPSGTSKVQQQFASETNINEIMARQKTTGYIGNPMPKNPRKPIFGDFTQLDFQRMMNTVTDVQNAFMTLPAKIRSRFQNSPEQIIRFANDPANRKEALKMGLVLPTEEELEAMVTAPKEEAKPNVEQTSIVPKEETKGENK